jgi:hypothetical protein
MVFAVIQTRISAYWIFTIISEYEVLLDGSTVAEKWYIINRMKR